jgi:hypothetical protein
MQLLKKYCTFLLLAESSACFTKVVPSFVTCCIKVLAAQSEQAQRSKDSGRVQDNEAFRRINTVLNMLEIGSRPRVIFEKSLNILERSSTCGNKGI